MLEASTDWLEILLFTGMLAGIAFFSGVEAWRHWSDNRRIRKHLRN